MSTKVQSKDKLSKRSKKPLITQSKLFLEVASVIGKVRALEELTKAYREYSNKDDYMWFDWSCSLPYAYSWSETPQGYNFWDKIYNHIEEQQS